jgi:DNA-binding phage protein
MLKQIMADAISTGAPGAKPRYDTVLKLLHALGVKLSASPIHS